MCASRRGFGKSPKSKTSVVKSMFNLPANNNSKLDTKSAHKWHVLETKLSWTLREGIGVLGYRGRRIGASGEIGAYSADTKLQVYFHNYLTSPLEKKLELS